MKSKFNTPQRKQDKPQIDGYTFDSELEARYYVERIKPLLDNGVPFTVIWEAKIHPRYEILPKTGRSKAVYYIADFEIKDENGRIIVVDVKGMATEAALLKRKMFEHRYPDKDLRWVCYSKMDGGWIEYDELQKARAKRRKEKKLREGAGA